jgi:hypothetical protein
MRAPDRLRSRFRQAEVPDLAFVDQIPHGAGHVFDWHLRVDAMLVEQVDAIRLQPHQRRIGHFADALRAAVEAGIGVAITEAELGRDHDLVAERLHGLTDQFLVGEGPVGLGRVEERDPAFKGGTDQLDASLLVDRRAITVAQAHAAVP